MNNSLSNGNTITRFSYYERVVHWTVALTFVYLALTGLALWSPRLYWLAEVFGGGETVRAWHPWAGVIFSAALGQMFINWARQMWLDRDDRRWLMQTHKYAMHDESGLPEPGRFNAGQKSMFWIQCLCAVILLGSGIVLWWPEAMSRQWRLIAIVLHPASAVLSMAGIIIHFYMATIATPGSLRGMVQGWVSKDWAKAHHPKWHREISDR